MLVYPDIDPIAFQLGPLVVRWYGLMYLLGFAAAYYLGTKRAKAPGSGWTVEEVNDLVFYGALGVVVGGRVGYMLFYNFTGLLHDPLSLFAVWQGGMSFHGGFLGVGSALYLFARKTGKPLHRVWDFAIPLVPIGLGAGRIGNFIGAELYGRITDAPWGMVFPGGGPFPRHPSQLYEAFLEGVVLFTVLWFYSRKPRPPLAVSGVFLVGYGCFRFLIEFFREPDIQIGFVVFDWLTMGQLLSLPMIALGLFLVTRKVKYNAGLS